MSPHPDPSTARREPLGRTTLRASLLATRETTLLDLLDTILDTGVVAQGELVISVAEVDLVFVGIKLVLASVETMQSWREAAKPIGGNGGNGHEPRPWQKASPSPTRFLDLPEQERPALAKTAGDPGEASRRLPVDPDKVEQGLAKLVLTVVELLRRLLEKQGIRRMEGGSLTEEETERMGRAFQRLEQKMQELKTVFGLEGEELNLNLGPLGNLV